MPAPVDVLQRFERREHDDAITGAKRRLDDGDAVLCRRVRRGAYQRRSRSTFRESAAARSGTGGCRAAAARPWRCLRCAAPRRRRPLDATICPSRRPPARRRRAPRSAPSDRRRRAGSRASPRTVSDIGARPGRPLPRTGRRDRPRPRAHAPPPPPRRRPRVAAVGEPEQRLHAHRGIRVLGRVPKRGRRGRRDATLQEIEREANVACVVRSEQRLERGLVLDYRRPRSSASETVASRPRDRWCTPGTSPRR